MFLNLNLLKNKSLRGFLISLSFLIKSVIILGTSLFLNLAQADYSISEELSQAKKSVWKYSTEIEPGTVYSQGTGFFISEKHFVTNFHVLYDDNLNINNIKLTQNDNFQNLKIKKTLQVSHLYDLALLEIEGKVSHYLKLGELEKENLLHVIGYPGGEFQRMKQQNNSLINAGGIYYAFYVNHFDLPGTSGSPILNEQGKVVGIVSNGNENEISSIYPNFLQKFIRQELGLNCLDFIDAISCMKKEIENTKAKAEQGDIIAQSTLVFMYLNGEGTKPNLEKALYWHKKSIQQGNLYDMNLTNTNLAKTKKILKEQVKCKTVFK